jgi:hypothetical protein
VFLRFTNFYRRFIHRYSAIIRPLVDHITTAQAAPPPRGEVDGSKKKKPQPTQKGPTKWYKPWSWPDNVRQAFLALRDKFTDAPVLQHFNPAKPIIVLTDASDFAIAAILLQPQGSKLATNCH